MRIVRSFCRIVAYLAVCGSLLVGWMTVLAGLGISSEDVTPAMAMISIPFMLWIGLADKASPQSPCPCPAEKEQKVPLHKVERDLG